MSDDKHAVSQRPTVVGEGDSVNRNGPGNFAEDESLINQGQVYEEVFY